MKQTKYNQHSQTHQSPTTNFLIGESEEGDDMVQRHHLVTPTEAQFAFGKVLESGVETLLQRLGISGEESRAHRIYDSEIIQLGPEVSFILVMPAMDSVCSINETSMSINLNTGDLDLIPLQSWELLHVASYYRKLLTVFAKLSSILEVDLLLAKQSQREAMRPGELDSAAETLERLGTISERLEVEWSGVRWVREVLSVARLKSNVGIPVSCLQDWYLNQPDTPDDSQLSCSSGGHSAGHRSAQHYVTRDKVSGLSRTPTTRSDPLQQLMNKENESQLTNLAHMRSRLMSAGSGHHLDHGHLEHPGHGHGTAAGQHSNYSSLNSIDSNDNEILNQIYPGHELPLQPNILQVYAAYDTGNNEMKNI